MKIKDMIKLGIVTEETDIAQFITRDKIKELLKEDFEITEDNTENYEDVVDECASNAYENLVTGEELYFNIQSSLELQGRI